MSTAEVATLTEKTEKLQHDVNEMRQSLSNAQSSLYRIEKSLIGDSEMMHVGIVETLKANTKSIGLLEGVIEDMQTQKLLDDKIKKNDKWWIGGIVGSLTAVGTWLVNYFFNK
jgi:hypothetical protein